MSEIQLPKPNGSEGYTLTITNPDLPGLTVTFPAGHWERTEDEKGNVHMVFVEDVPREVVISEGYGALCFHVENGNWVADPVLNPDGVRVHNCSRTGSQPPDALNAESE